MAQRFNQPSRRVPRDKWREPIIRQLRGQSHPSGSHMHTQHRHRNSPKNTSKKPITGKQTQSSLLMRIPVFNLGLQTTWAFLSLGKNNFREFYPHQTGNGKWQNRYTLLGIIMLGLQTYCSLFVVSLTTMMGGCLAPCCWFIYHGMQTHWLLCRKVRNVPALRPYNTATIKTRKTRKRVKRRMTCSWNYSNMTMEGKGELQTWRNARMNVLELHFAGGIPSRWPTACFFMLRHSRTCLRLATLRT
jgi:hypothetical protein